MFLLILSSGCASIDDVNSTMSSVLRNTREIRESQRAIDTVYHNQEQLRNQFQEFSNQVNQHLQQQNESLNLLEKKLSGINIQGRPSGAVIWGSSNEDTPIRIK